MSQLSDLTASPRSDVIPGQLLSPLGMAEIGMAEEEFARIHVRMAAMASEAMPEAQAKRITDDAMLAVRAGTMNYGGYGFDAACWSVANVPFLLWLSLRVSDKAITRDQAAAMLNADNWHKVHRAILELMGYSMGPSKKKDVSTGPEESPTGEPSSAPSASAD